MGLAQYNVVLHVRILWHAHFQLGHYLSVFEREKPLFLTQPHGKPRGAMAVGVLWALSMGALKEVGPSRVLHAK